jgi:hypothetical protein
MLGRYKGKLPCRVLSLLYFLLKKALLWLFSYLFSISWEREDNLFISLFNYLFYKNHGPLRHLLLRWWFGKKRSQISKRFHSKAEFTISLVSYKHSRHSIKKTVQWNRHFLKIIKATSRMKITFTSSLNKHPRISWKSAKGVGVLSQCPAAFYKPASGKLLKDDMNSFSSTSRI